MKNIISIFILISYINASSKIEDFINTLNSNINILNANNEIIKETKELINNYDSNKYLTVFYFVDSEVTNVMIKTFSNSINKLKNKEPRLQGKVMLRGLIEEDFKKTATFFKNMTENEKITNIEYYPIHFHSFKYFDLERVPAYALSLCSQEFNFRKCEHLYLVKGDINLPSFFEIVSNENPKYKYLYFSFGEQND